MLVTDPLGLDSSMLSEAKAYLRLENDDEDASLGAIILAAIGHAEAFTGQLLIRRDCRETLTATSQWQTLAPAPVNEVAGVTGIPAEGATSALAASAWEVRFNSHGEASVRVLRQGGEGRVEIAYRAGVAGEWADLPEPLRLGLLRLIAHLYSHRDSADDVGLPAAATALLRPWRRVRL